MKRAITCILFSALLALILFWSPAYAAKQVATVVAVRGNVQAEDAKGKSRPLLVRSPIFEDDTIRTKERSRVQIMFTDNTLISLGDATTMKIDEYRWQPEQKDGALKTQIKEGTFRVMGGALSKAAPQNFKTKTPTATIGIRGSMYAGVVTADFLSVVFQGGAGIEVTNAFGTVEINKPGYGTKVAMGKPPLSPAKFTAQELGELNKTLSGNGEEEKKEETQESSPVEQQGPVSKEQSAEDTTTAPAALETETLSDWETTTSDPVTETTPTLDSTSLTTTQLGPVFSDLATDVQTDSSQTDLVTTVDETAATTVVNRTSLAGKYRFFRRDIDLTLTDPTHFNSTFLAYDAGTVATTLLDNGELYSSLSNGKSFGPYLVSGYNPSATSYSGFNISTGTITYNDDSLGLLSLPVTTYTEPSGQFFYNTFYSTIAGSPDYLLGFLLYAGTPSLSIPTAGINEFTGHLLYSSSSSFDADLEKTNLEVSYYNRRFIGRSSEMNADIMKNNGAIFFGTVNSDGTADVIILAEGDPQGTNVTAASGSGTATLYGGFNQGLSFTASGADYSLADNTQQYTWQVTGAALRATATEIISSYPTAAISYTGFVVGVADNTATGTASRIFMNSGAADFTMSVNPTTGTIDGSLSADELLGGIPLSNITIGHATDPTKSAYVLNDQMVAILSDADPNYALSSYGNFLYTAGPDAPEITNVSNEFMTWGYWEMAYTDPNDPVGSQSKDHLFSSQSFFVAGQQTPVGDMNSLIASNFTGTYTGKAFGVQIDTSGQAIRLTSAAGANQWGSVNLNINFAAAATSPVSGTIAFDQASLAISSAAGTLSNSGFTAIVSSVSGTTFSATATATANTVNGAFYGPDAQAVGGNFHAQMDSGVRYLGVFGGNR